MNEAMKLYEDRVDTEFVKTKDDDGEFVYCLPFNRKNYKKIYTPYELEIVSKEEVEHEDIYFTASATHVTMVKIKLFMILTQFLNRILLKNILNNRSTKHY